MSTVFPLFFWCRLFTFMGIHVEVFTRKFLINGKRGLDFYPGFNVWFRSNRSFGSNRVSLYPLLSTSSMSHSSSSERWPPAKIQLTRRNHLAVMTGCKVRLNTYSATNPTILPFKIEQLPFISGFLPFVRLQFRLYRMNIGNILAEYIFTSSINGRSILQTNMNNKFLEALFTLVRQRENPPEISSL